MEGFRNTQEQATDVWRTAEIKAELFERARFNPEEFIDIYGEEKVRNDLAYVEQLKQKIDEERNEMSKVSKAQATIFEAIVADRLQNGGWFGEIAQAFPTSEYDDWVAGVDQILEFGKGLNHIGLAVDVTFSNQLKKKFTRIHDELSRGLLPTVKYFQSGPYKGQLEVPRVVVGLSHANLEKLPKMWVDPSQESRMRIHPFRRLLTEQIGLQLKKYTEFAAHKEQERIADILETASRMFETEVKVAGVVDENWQADQVNQAIRSNIQIFDTGRRR